MSKTEENVLNFHFTDRCNFSCKHCFVNMQKRNLTLENCKSVIDNIVKLKFFSRINLAGGEPMLARYLQELIDYIFSKGLKCSLITNGSKLTKDFIMRNKQKLSMIGISVDAPDDEGNEKIGRKTIPDLVEHCNTIKRANIKLKINICVSKTNIKYDFMPLLRTLNPDRLKLLKIMPSSHSNASTKMAINNKTFEHFCNKYSEFDPKCEDNNYMRSAYWIVDSQGFFGKDNLHSPNKQKINMINPINSLEKSSLISFLHQR